MKLDLLALRSLILAAALFGLALLATWGVVSAGLEDVLVPTPKTTAEEFLRAMKAHRYSGAHEFLSAQLSEEISEENLRELGGSLEIRHGGFAEAYGKSEEEQAESATATAIVQFDGGTELEIELPMVREEGIWRIASIQPLLNLAS